MFHPNSNKRYRLKLKQFCCRILHRYCHGIPPEPQSNNNGYKSHELKIIGSDGERFFLEPIRVNTPTEKGKVVAHYGTPPEGINYLFSLS